MKKTGNNHSYFNAGDSPHGKGGATMKRRFWIFTLATVFGLTAVFGSTAAAKTYTIILGVGVPATDNYGYLSCKRFKDLTEKYTGGQVKVDIYPGGQLGDEQETIRSMQIGTVHASMAAVNNYNVFAPSLGYYTLPYMFDSVEQFRKVTDAMWENNNMWSVKEAGIRLLSILEINFRHLTNSKHPVKTLDDLKGLRIRVPRNKIMVSAFKSFGVEPVAMAFAETFNALQQGVIDGQEASYNIVVSQKFYEAQKYATMIGYIIHSGCIVISEKFLRSLPPDFQEAVVRAGKEAMYYERGLSDKMYQEDIKFLKSHGIEVFGPPLDKPEWVKRARASWPEAYKIIGGGDEKKGKEIVDLVEKIKTVNP